MSEVVGSMGGSAIISLPVDSEDEKQPTSNQPLHRKSNRYLEVPFTSPARTPHSWERAEKHRSADKRNYREQGDICLLTAELRSATS